MLVYKLTIYHCPDIDALYTKKRKDFIISKQACLFFISWAHSFKSCAFKFQVMMYKSFKASPHDAS